MKKGNYNNFSISLDIRSVDNGKGYISFHQKNDDGGYKIAINNDLQDPIWWRMTGSLVSVRNLTKSFVKDNEWFNMNIIVDNNIIIVKINDIPVVEYIDTKNRSEERRVG